MKRDKIGLFLLLMLFVGICVLLYPAFSQYWNTRTQTRTVETYRQTMTQLDGTDYSQWWDEAERYNTALSQLQDPLYHYDQISGYDEALDRSGLGIMGYLSISKLNVELPIYHGVSEDVLNIACGHLEGTSLPIGGEGTHCVLSAHRGLPHARLFTDLDKMEPGDLFTITVLDETLTYQVDQVLVVEPNDTSEITMIDGEDHCTLLTCTPYGINSHRLLVRGTRVENAAPVLYVTSNAYRIDSLVATPAVAAPMLLILLLALMIKYRGKGRKPLLEQEDDL